MARLAAISNPLPNLSWGYSYHRAHRLLREGSFRRATASPEDTADKPDESISLTGAEVLLKQPANVEVIFAQDRMNLIVVTFSQAPAFAGLVAEFKKTFGNPAREKLVDVASEQSEVQWVVRKPAGTVTILATEVPGVVRVTYSLQR